MKAVPLVLLLFVFVYVAAAERPSLQNDQCSRTFFSALVQLLPCRAAVTRFRPLPPSEGCCTALKTLGGPCLCVLINGPMVTGVDHNMVMELPAKCGANFEPCDTGL